MPVWVGRYGGAPIIEGDTFEALTSDGKRHTL
jgi:hypothetical protein